MSTPEHSGEPITILKIDPREPGTLLEILTTAQESDGRLAERHSADGGNISPPLSWTGVPGAGAYALIVEDPDAPREQPFLHWMVWNIPGGETRLLEALPADRALVRPAGAIQGRNDSGGYGWYGPKPPPGHGLHRYYFQLFALDEPLRMDADTPLRDLVNALKAHTIAKGELVATYETPAEGAPETD